MSGPLEGSGDRARPGRAQAAGFIPGTDQAPGVALPDVRKAIELIEEFSPHPEEEECYRRVRKLLRKSRRPFSRKNFSPGHITASGVVLSPDQESVLLVYHKRLERWLQPGGHVERKDRKLRHTARREVREETGVRLLNGVPEPLVGVSVHPIPRRGNEPRHFHHDLMFRFLAADTGVAASSEVREAVWCPVDRLADYGADRHLANAVARALTEF